MKSAKLASLALLLVSLLALFSITGCATDGTAPAEPLPEGISQQDLDQILADAITHYESLNTYKFDMDMDMEAEIIGGAEEGTMTMYYQMAGGVNVASQQMQMNLEMSMDAVGIGSQEMYIEMYLLQDWVYMKMEMPGIDEQWMKMPATEEFTAAFNTEAIDQQMGILDSPVTIEYLRSETVDGLDCYVFAVTPDINSLAEMLSQQNTGIEDFDWDEITDISSVFEKISYVCYVSKDTHIMRKMISELQLEMTPEMVGVSAADFNSMTMNMCINMTLYDHNEPFSITLPDEAEDAMEVSEDMFL